MLLSLFILATCIALVLNLYFGSRSAEPKIVWESDYWVSDSSIKLGTVSEVCGLTIPEEEAALSIKQLLNNELGRRPWNGDSISLYGATFLVVTDTSDRIYIYPDKISRDVDNKVGRVSEYSGKETSSRSVY